MSTAGRQLGVDMANNFMLMTLFSLIADTAEDPDGFRTDVKNALFDLADHHNLPGVAPGVLKKLVMRRSWSSAAFSKTRDR